MFKKSFRDYFIPHGDNGYAPHSLQKGAVVGMLFLVILSFTITNVLSLLWVSSEWMVSTILPAVIVDLTNKERGAESLGTLQRNSVLDEAARMKAEDMADNEYFAHYSPTGVSPWYWFGQAKYNFVNAGENLAIHFSDSSDVMKAWMDSPTHRANIMDGKYTEIGIGTAKGRYQGFDTVYVVQLFGTPSESIKTVTPKPAPVVAGDTVSTPVKKTTTTDTQVLAQAVSIEESVVIEKAQLIPTTTEKEPIKKNAVPAEVNASTSTTTAVVTSPLITSTKEVEVPKEGTPLYLDFISTTTDGIPATIDTSSTGGESTALFLSLATQPHKILQGVYVLIGLLVFFSLLLSIFIEIRHQQPMQIVYGVGLLMVMFGLFYVHVALTTGAMIL